MAEPCALRVSQDYKLAWQNVFKLQRLLKKREDMRFAHLLQACNLDCSLLQECNAHYREISQEIGDIRSKWDPHAVGESTRTLEQDPKYLAARLALADRAKKFAERIQR